ncbi:thioredoxin domain-containing protein [Arthrobacter sp. zg-Y820]|uniref:DsbA family protein n=1 Tax=unclassified Arthrobacter TaxID=235627 RepID=UPI001E4D9829|nr:MULTISPECIES: thioredoxin domain-containing protein [unclassified Arthrobacter]MCC9198246.1 thioredoxin domain-containing protein [Arthrobacter sp. zg-Y820]MDK1281115.1 thioredoxin domain-containing protein [Arthrobacter sp. zg.Y820]WIB09713.1 thioredoxin domain-containing protein [Arthrobacter sp. zg-Y820]
MRKSILALVMSGLLATGSVVSCAGPEPTEGTASPETTASAPAATALPADRVDQVAPADARAITDPADPQATLVLFTDYQCPYCAMMDPLIQQAKNDYGDQVRILVRNYPLPKHQNAETSARAVEAAAEQDALEEMAAAVFEHQEEWKNQTDVEDLFVSYAGDLGLDTEKFRADYNSDAIKDRVARDLQDSQDLQLPGTPSLVLDNQVLALDSVDYSAIQEQLDKALNN